MLSCDANDSSEDLSDDFDREAMLVNWADNIIVPAYEAYAEEVETMGESVKTFVETPDLDNLNSLRAQWQSAYLAWETVAMYQIGEAEILDMQGNMNTFPTNAEVIEELIVGGIYDLNLPSRREVQGFPAIDYLINGLAENDEAIVSQYEETASYALYLTTASSRIKELTDAVVADWNTDYRDEFVANSGSSATSSVNKLTNDFIFYYEARLRSKKVSTPSGVFSGQSNTTLVEAYYENDISKLLFQTALSASSEFFNGQYFESSTQGESLKTYLDYIDGINGNDELLGDMINVQYDLVTEATSTLGDSFSDQVDTDLTSMFELHEALQGNVVYFKTNMISALNIRVDYVDADGD